jgi:membrane-bound lytic murein transglycosylase B
MNIYCQAESASSNARIIRTTREYLEKNTPAYVIIGWSTWEREEWIHDGKYWQVNAGGIGEDWPEVIKFKYKNWIAYQARFIESKRIEAGVQFWKQNQQTLQEAEDKFGVPAWLVVGIIGVETFYGQHTGNFRTLDALSTLTFDFPSAHPRAIERQAFFSKELANFLVLAHQEKMKVTNIKGSYAGALGLPQFMPSSWARFAIDFDGDKHIDLFSNKADVIGSVANYFKAFQWRPGMPTHYPVQFDASKLDMDALMAPDILPTFSVPSFLAKGAVLEGEALNHAGPLALIELLNGDAPPSYVAGTENFYAITRYNWSSYYAMAVIELGEAVARQIQNKP